jgi:hypothetical protein
MTGPGYDLLVALHVLSAVVGFGAVAVSGVYAAGARSATTPERDAKLARYFRPGTNWAERALLVTPVLGAIVLVVGDRPAATQLWPWAGLGCWVVATAVATGWCWPAERRIQQWLAAGAANESAALDIVAFRRACRDVQWGASAISVLFLVAVVVMIGQPG